jgi:hypothetical protein
MIVALAVLWIFLALISGTALSAYVWQRRSGHTHPPRDGGQRLRHALSPFSPWTVDRDDHA